MNDATFERLVGQEQARLRDLIESEMYRVGVHAVEACECELEETPMCALPDCRRTARRGYHTYCSKDHERLAQDLRNMSRFCACGCGGVVPGGAPLRRRYASSACRLRDHRRKWRRRAVKASPLPVETGPGVEE